MNLPNNGRIVIVDDNINEVKPLMNILSKRRIPFNYYDGTKIVDFPSDADENSLRVLFLDLNIFELNKDAKTVISSIDAILRRIIPENPNPYLLVIWSKQNHDYKQVLEQHFVDNMPAKSPAKIIFLQKSSYFDYDGQTWIPQTDCIQRIENDLDNELNTISVLSSLISWENIIHANTGATIKEFSSLYEFDGNWDKRLKAVLYMMAESIVGPSVIKNMSDNQKLSKAFSNFNSFLLDKIENEVEDQKLGELKNILKAGVTIPPSIIAKINTKLHLTNKELTITEFSQGNMYLLPNQQDMINKILWAEKFKNQKRSELLDSSPQLVQLDITPVCDYSQNKDYVRTVYGILFDNTHFDECRANKTQFYYLTPIVEVSNREKFMLFDFRFIETTSKEEIIKRGVPPQLKLKKEICTDIQSQLSNQINRPGISSL